MAKKTKGNEVRVKADGVDGDMNVAGGNIVHGAFPDGTMAGFQGNKVDVEGKNLKGKLDVAGGHIIFNKQLEELRAELRHAYAGNPQALARINDLTDDLAAEAQQPAEARDTGRVRRLLQRLEQMAFEAGAAATAGVAVEAFRAYLLP